MLYFAPEVVGKTRSKTPEGFLICYGVPFARIGQMIYTKRDLPAYEARDDGTIQVFRFKDELFRPETIASFEGKPTTDDHPPGGDMMNPDTYRKYATGHMQNVRPGEGEFADCLLADLIVMDAECIKSIEEDDKVQVSAGYDAKYRKTGVGTYEQYDIIGNHNAFVFAGRCGPRCAVGDSEAVIVNDKAPCACDGACSCKKGKKMARPNLKEALKTTVASLAELQKTFDEAANTEVEGGSHVHIHMPEGKDDVPGVGDKRIRDKRSKDGEPVGDPLDNNEGISKIIQMLDSLNGRMNTMEDALYDVTEDARIAAVRDKRFKDAGETEEEKKAREEKEAKDRKAARDARMARDNKSGGTENPLGSSDKRGKDGMEGEETMTAEDKAARDKRMRDGDATEEEMKKEKADEKTTDAARNSSGLKTEFEQVVALAAIIAPGLSVPTFDALNHVATTAKSMCNFRRAALKNALSREDTKLAIAGVVDSVATLDSWPCASVRLGFNAAAELIKQRNNAKTRILSGTIATTDTSNAGKGYKTPAEINALNKARWG
jgi:hypothetical protein